MSLRRAAATGCLALGLAGLGVLAGGVARADDSSTSSTDSTTSTSVAPTTATSKFTLPLFGAPLTISVSTNAGGGLTGVAVNPADATAVELRPNKVEFVTTTPGQSEIKVGARHGSQGVFAKTDSLDNILGDGEWSGDVFGDGTTTTVGYKIAKASDGSPDITNVTSSDTSAVIGTVDHHDGEHGQVASVKVTFTKELRQRSLRVTAGVFTGHDGQPHAIIAVLLDHERSVNVPIGTATGDHTWSTKLCDGSDATISYTIDADGALINVQATPTATITAKGDRTLVQFSDTERVALGTKVDNGNIRIRIQPMLKCGHTIPSVNTPTSLEQGDGQGDGPGDDHGDGKGDGPKPPMPGSGVEAGAKSWDGKLCDGSAAHIDFTLNADGTISGVSATPTATVSAMAKGTIVKFADTAMVGIAGRLKDGVLKLAVVPKIFCGSPVSVSIPDHSVPMTTEGGDGGGSNWPGGDHKHKDHPPTTSTEITVADTVTTGA